MLSAVAIEWWRLPLKINAHFGDFGLWFVQSTFRISNIYLRSNTTELQTKIAMCRCKISFDFGNFGDFNKIVLWFVFGSISVTHLLARHSRGTKVTSILNSCCQQCFQISAICFQSTSNPFSEPHNLWRGYKQLESNNWNGLGDFYCLGTGMEAILGKSTPEVQPSPFNINQIQTQIWQVPLSWHFNVHFFSAYERTYLLLNWLKEGCAIHAVRSFLHISFDMLDAIYLSCLDTLNINWVPQILVPPRKDHCNWYYYTSKILLCFHFAPKSSQCTNYCWRYNNYQDSGPLKSQVNS